MFKSLLKKLLVVALLPLICQAQSWQLSAVEKGVINGVHVMSIEPPFTDDLSAYHFALNLPCPKTGCAVLFVHPDAPLPTQFPLTDDYYPWVMAYKVEAWDWRAEAYRCLAPVIPSWSYFPCLDFVQLNDDFRDWQARKIISPHPSLQETWFIINRLHYSRAPKKNQTDSLE